MSKETIRMRKLRLERIALKKALRESENKVVENRRMVGENWEQRDTSKEAFRAIKKYGRIIAKERDKLKAYRGLLRSTKDEIKKLNRQHDIRMSVLAEKGE
jgi:hypothetical protein